MAFELENDFDNIVQIKVVGVGGGGGNALDRMVTAGVKCVDFVSVNTDKQALIKFGIPYIFNQSIYINYIFSKFFLKCSYI